MVETKGGIQCTVYYAVFYSFTAPLFTGCYNIFKATVNL